jgi:glutathione S-transferase
MRATLFGVPASHPSLAAELMLQHKRIDYRRIDLVTAAHRGLLRALGFPGKTVPAIRINGAKVQGTTAIALALDSLVPSPPLFPAVPERRAAVLEAESWGNEVLQPVPRRLIWNGLKRDRSTVASYLEGARLGIPTGLAARTSAPIASAARSGAVRKAVDRALGLAAPRFAQRSLQAVLPGKGETATRSPID